MLNLTIESITKTTDFKLLSGPSILFLLILKLQAFISTYVHFFSAVPVSNESYLAIKKHHYLANDILNFSNLLYNHFFFFFLIIGVILLLAMLGVLVLSLNISSSRILKISKNKSIDLTYIPTENYIGFSLIIFFLSMLGVSINKQKNFLIIMLFFELMLFSLSLLCVVISVQFYGPQGQLFALFIMAIAVSESSIGLGILIVLFRINKKLDFNNFSTLKC
jgi:NADH-quinone oxidoreductase subunit K